MRLEALEALLGSSRTLYELTAIGADNAKFAARYEYLRAELAIQTDKYKRREADALKKLGLPKDNEAAWNDFYRRTLDDSQCIENLKAELEARAPRRVLAPEDDMVSPLYARALKKYNIFANRPERS